MIVEPFLRDVRHFAHGAVVPFGAHAASPSAFWEEVLLRLLHGLRAPMLTKRAVDILLATMHKGRASLLSLHKVFHIYVDCPGERLILVDSRLLLTGRLKAPPRGMKRKPPIPQSSAFGGRCGAWQLRLLWVHGPVHRGLPGLLSGCLDVPMPDAEEEENEEEVEPIPPALALRLPSAIDAAKLQLQAPPRIGACKLGNGGAGASSCKLILRMAVELDAAVTPSRHEAQAKKMS